VGSTVDRRTGAAGTTSVGRLRTACSVGPPTGSDTISPPDQLSISGDYVFILAYPTVIFSYKQNRKEGWLFRRSNLSPRFHALPHLLGRWAPVAFTSPCETVSTGSPRS